MSAAWGALAFVASWSWLLLPVNAVVSIWRRRLNRPDSSCWFAYAVLTLWVASVIGLIKLVLMGPLEGIGGPSEAAGDLYSLEIAGVTVPLHWALIAFGKEPPAERDEIQ